MNPERRRSPRVCAELHVELRHLGRPATTAAELTRDISAGGVFIDTSVGLEVGTEVALEIAAGEGLEPVRLFARVVRVEERPLQPGSTSTDAVRGMAFAFIDGDPAEIERLVALAKQQRGTNAR